MIYSKLWHSILEILIAEYYARQAEIWFVLTLFLSKSAQIFNVSFASLKAFAP